MGNKLSLKLTKEEELYNKEVTTKIDQATDFKTLLKSRCPDKKTPENQIEVLSKDQMDYSKINKISTEFKNLLKNPKRPLKAK